MSTSIKITTRVGGGPPLTLEYMQASYTIGDGLVVVTHVDPKTRSRMLSKMPMANVVQIMELMPEKAS